MNFQDTLTSVMGSLVNSFEQETLEKNEELLVKLKKIYAQNPNDFLEKLQMAQHHFNTLVSHVMELPASRNQYILEYIASGLYKHFHEKRIEKLEGSACCADKSSFIEQKTIQALKTNENLLLFADYQQVEQIKKDKGRKAYWSPETVTDTNQAMELFWDWYLMRSK